MNEELQSLLLQKLSPNGNGLLPATEDLLAELEARNPDLALVTRCVLQTPAQGQAPALAADEVDELHQLRGVNDALASALGACSECWGADAYCGRCYGRGRPGGKAPDRELFDRLVAPAVHRLRAADRIARQQDVQATPSSAVKKEGGNE